MKVKLFLSCLLGMTSVCAIAQLTIDSLGVIRTNPPFYINSNSSQLYSAIAAGSKHALCVKNNGVGETGSNGSVTRYGLYVSNYLDNNKTNIGIMIYPKTDQTTIKPEYGTMSYSGNSSSGNYSVFGGFHNPSAVTNGAGIFGSDSILRVIPAAYTGRYAGFFIGNVRVLYGTLTGTLVTPSASLSMLGKDDIEDVRTVTDVDVAERLSQVQLLAVTRVEKPIDQGDSFPIYTDEGEAVVTEVGSSSKMHPSTCAKTGYSLDASQLREVFPELVYEDQNGNVSINYIEMIPLMLQYINELKSEVDELKDGSGDVVTKEVTQKNKTIATTDDDTLLLSLGQNNPNPFSEQTSIEVSIPENVSAASLLIFDMQGKQVKKIDIDERGKFRITVTRQGLTEGMYLYSLIADGKVVQTRKMILSK